jgi:hypothetical protein
MPNGRPLKFLMTPTSLFCGLAVGVFALLSAAAKDVHRLFQAGVDVTKAHAGLSREDCFVLGKAAHAHLYMGRVTDNGTPMNFHTDALWRKMKAMAGEGRPPLEVISDTTA